MSPVYAGQGCIEAVGFRHGSHVRPLDACCGDAVRTSGRTRTPTPASTRARTGQAEPARATEVDGPGSRVPGTARSRWRCAAADRGGRNARRRGGNTVATTAHTPQARPEHVIQGGPEVGGHLEARRQRRGRAREAAGPLTWDLPGVRQALSERRAAGPDRRRLGTPGMRQDHGRDGEDPLRRDLPEPAGIDLATRCGARKNPRPLLIPAPGSTTGR